MKFWASSIIFPTKPPLIMPRVSRSRSYQAFSRRHGSSSKPYKKRPCSKYQYKSYVTTASFKYCKYSSSSHSRSISPHKHKYYSRKHGSPHFYDKSAYKSSRRRTSKNNSKDKKTSYKKKFKKSFPYLKQESQ